MFTVDLLAKIRLAHRDGLGIRALARHFGVSRQTVRRALEDAEPPPLRQPQVRPAPKLDPFKPFLEQMLHDDRHAPPKQRHTAQRLFERLVNEHGYRGGYDQVRRYVHSRRRARTETFIPLDHEPGQRAECDFGHVHVDFPDGRRAVPVFLMTWAWSHFTFALALPSEKTEAILEGMVQALNFFDAVPRELWWDNPTTVVTALLPGRQRHLHPRYQALASHYNFEPLFCLPRRGNEKPNVENRVKWLQRRWATPVPRVTDRNELNAGLRRQALAERERIVQRCQQSIGERFDCERQAALPLPAFAFDACVLHTAQVDKYQTVRFDNNGYSVPRTLAFQNVTVKGYVEQVQIVHRGQVVATHPRSYERHTQVLDPLHYLQVLGRKPAALDHAGVYRQWQLPANFTRLRQHFENCHGPRGGARHYIGVLQLLACHPLARVERAVALALSRGWREARRLVDHVEHLAAGRSDSAMSPAVNSDTGVSLQQTTDTGVSLRHFDQLLSQGDPCHD